MKKAMMKEDTGKGTSRKNKRMGQKNKLAAFLALALALTACGQGDQAGTGSQGDPTPSQAESGEAAGANAAAGADQTTDKTYTIGISEFADNPSLDNCRDGLIQGLKAAGLEEGKNLNLLYKNANADMGVADQIAKDFVGKQVDMIVAIATPSAMYAYNEAGPAQIPVVYVAISDPIEAKLAQADGKPVGQITGVSDALPVEAQLAMIRQILPEAKSIGILFTSSEPNSVSTLRRYKEAAPKYGFDLVDQGVTGPADIPAATDSLLGKVDCLCNMTDLNVVNNLPLILQKCADAKKPCFGSEIEQVKEGCLACQGIDYISLGKQTGAMAAKILKGEQEASEIPFETVEKPFLYINQAVSDQLKLTLDPDLIQQADQVFDQITPKEAQKN
jgi:putative ABC transport system substrate-binding protein